MRRRAVIFDDDPLIRYALWHLFDDREYEVFTFPEPGLCPLHVVLQCPCPTGTSCADLILSDVNMHAANGIDYIQQLIQKGCRQRHFALMSGNFSDHDLTRGSELRCKLFTKPLDMDEVKNWIEGVERSIASERVLFDWA
jgi:DNA-binding response OmpR family regulator